MKNDPFADIRNKRLSELTEVQADRAFELWLRENALSFGRYYSEGDRALFPSVFRVIDRLRDVQQKPLTEEQIEELIALKHFDPSYSLKASDKVCLEWYRLGVRDAERKHGIDIAK